MTEAVERWLYRFSKSKSRRHLYEWIAEAVDTYDLRSKKVLNVGAGGEIAALLRRLGVACTAIDNDPTRGPDHVASVEDLRMFAAASFDAVLCFEVLEHVECPERGVSEIARVLRPGGVLVGSTPFLLGIHDAPGDYRRFTRFGLERLLSGLEPVSLRQRNGYFASAAVLMTRRFAIGNPQQKRRALALSPIILLLASATELLDRWLPCDADGTTGYFFVVRRCPA
jgi:SAM-dependent methyltransferase